MKLKHYSYIATLCLALCIAWIALLIISTANRGQITSLDGLIGALSHPDLFNYLNYVCVALLTLAVTALFTGLYAYCRATDRELALAGLIFVPVYCAFNLIAYLSQITLVPALIAAYQRPEERAIARLLLEQAIQFWPGSAIMVLNNLAYALLGVSSMVFGLLLIRRGKMAKIAGWLLILNAVTCILGFLGILGGIGPLQIGSMVGGVLFTLALVPLTLMFRGEKGQDTP